MLQGKYFFCWLIERIRLVFTGSWYRIQYHKRITKKLVVPSADRKHNHCQLDSFTDHPTMNVITAWDENYAKILVEKFF